MLQFSIFRTLSFTALGLVLGAIVAGEAMAQNTSVTDAGTPSALAKGSHPLGSFSGGDFDTVNLFNGNVSFRIPLAGKDGRAGMGASVMLTYNSKIWRTSHLMEEPNIDRLYATNVPWDSKAGEIIEGSGWVISAGRMTARSAGHGDASGGCEGLYLNTLTTFTLIAPDGTEYEFRDAATDGGFRPINSQNCGGFERGTKFVSTDGTAATFIADAPVVDRPQRGQIPSFNVAGTVFLRDGTRYGIAANGNVLWQQDRNGNRINFDYTTQKLTKVTDTLGRTINIAYGNQSGSGQFNAATITWTGSAGSLRTITIKGNSYQNLLRAGVTQQNIGQLFNSSQATFQSAGSFPTAKVVEKIILPGGYEWNFLYNAYAEVAHVATPAGGGVVYEYNTDTTGTSTGEEIKRRVRERRSYLTRNDPGSSTTGLASKTTYSDPFIPSVNGEVPVTEVRFETDGTTRQSTIEHVFGGSPLDSYLLSFGTPAHSGFRPWREGKELRTAVKNGPGTLLLRRIENTWEQRSGWGTNPPTELLQPSVDPRLKEVRTILGDVNPNRFTDTVYQYDQFNNVTNEKVYDYGTNRGPLLRETQRTFVTTYTAFGPTGGGLSLNYVTSNGSNDEIIHRRSLVLSEKVLNGAGTVEAQTDFEYDNYANAADGLHDAMVERSFAAFPLAVRDSRNANFNTDDERIGRGNVTKVTAAPHDAASTSVTYLKYDVCGNVVATIEPRAGQATAVRTVETSYEDIGIIDTYFSYPTASTRTATQPVGDPIDLNTETAYDANTGAVTSMKGFNDELTTFEYEFGANQLDRLLKVNHPTVAGTTTFTYNDDGTYPLTMTAYAPFDAGTSIWTKTEYDGLGRPTRTTREDAGGNVMTDTEYDSRGRARLVSNPYRAGESPTTSTTYGWTRMTYDALDRPLTVTTASDRDMMINVTGTVTSNYIGAVTTVEDQATKKRSTTADALGRTISVTEAPGVPNYGFVTTYAYDARGNLKVVTQGPPSEQQTRTFDYDGLSRMLRMTMPECDVFSFGGKSAAVHLKYDQAGNLIERRDSRSIVTTHAYDSVDRILSTTYTGQTTATPTADVSYFYDSATIPGITWLPSSRGPSLGRLVGVVTAQVNLGGEVVAPTAALYGYDLPGRVVRTGQVLDNLPTYFVSSVNVNQGGAPTQVNYPSGTALTPGYNASGQLSTLRRGVGGANYLLQSATYAPAGSLANQRLGTGNSLYHTIKYNNRLQPETIGLGTTLTGLSQFSALRLDYKYGVIGSAATQNGSINLGQNNGNIARIDITPGSGQQPIRQNFEYDALNRLGLAVEHFTPTTLAHLTSVSPPQGSPGATNLTVTISGTALTGASAVTFSDPNVTATIVGTPTATSVTANVTIAPGTATGPKTVRVTTPAGLSDNTLSFLVTAPTAGHDTIGLYDPAGSNWFQRYANAPGAADNVFGFGAGGQGLLPIDGDWNLDGMDTVGLYAPDSGVFLTNMNASGNADTVFGFGPANAGWLPIAGDWNGDGTDSVGLYDPATGGVFLKNVNSSGAADYMFTFGPANSGWKPIAGDWNGDGVDTIGLYDPSSGTFYLRNANAGGAADLLFSFGPAGWLPVIGDWNNDGTDTIGAFAPLTSEFYLRNQNSPGNADLVVAFGAAPSTMVPVAGDWNGSAARSGSDGDNAGKTAEVAAVSWTEDYDYDRFGNRLDGVTITKARNRIDETGYSYDGPGNLLSEPHGPGTTKVYKYNAENKMWRADIPGPTTATYVYDGEGRRVKKIVNGTVTRFIYGVGGELVAEYGVVNGNSVLQKEYVYGPTGLLATLQTNVVQYVTPDHLGSPRVITNGSGGVVSRHDYLPFGAEIMADTGGRTGTGMQGYGVTDGIRQQFTSKERDTETGLDYFGARYYGNSHGRFTSVDPLIESAQSGRPQSWNRYTYTFNNPLRYIDPDGRAAQDPGTDPAVDPGTTDQQIDLLLVGIFDKDSGLDITDTPRGMALAGLGIAISSSDAGLPVMDFAGLPLVIVGLLQAITPDTVERPVYTIEMSGGMEARKDDLGQVDYLADKYGVPRDLLSDEIHAVKQGVGRGGKSLSKEELEEIAREFADWVNRNRATPGEESSDEGGDPE